ncbi:MAG TPA: serine/threonine-protein kinase, partial [Gemmatirosa sp.]
GIASLLSAARFAREVRITARLRHPHLLPVLDSGEADGVPFYTMPYVEGESLAARLARDGPLPVMDALCIASEVADALAYAHARGYMHRDLKPGNILLSGYGTAAPTGTRPTADGAAATTGARTGRHALLTDFGIARAIDAGVEDLAASTRGLTGERLSESGTVLGTVHYMSPEQAVGDRLDGRSDLYGLGCVLYEMLTGAPPFTAPTARAVIARHVVDSPPSVRTVRPAVSEALQAIVSTALAKSPADRYADAGAMQAALDAERLAEATGVRTVGAPMGGAHAVAAGRPSGTRGVRTLVGATLAAGAIAASAFGVRAWRVGHGGPALDADRVLVFPLLSTVDVAGGGAGSPTLGEDVATVVGGVLDGAGGRLHGVDGWRLLPAARRADVRTLGADEAGAIARDQRARYYVTGRIVRRGADSAQVTLELQDADGDSTVARGQAVGPAAAAWRVALRAVNGVLPRLLNAATSVGAPGGTGDGALAGEWDDRDPGAVASYLAGEAAFRRLRPAEALAHYRDAVRRDSGFALAALRGAQAASWDLRAAEATALVDVALRHPLPTRYAHFARGYRAYVDGAADSAAAE